MVPIGWLLTATATAQAKANTNLDKLIMINLLYSLFYIAHA